MNPSLYIHVPFCRRKCSYCDFYSRKYDESLASDYVNALICQIKGLDVRNISTIYIGGGTPTVLSFPLLKKLLAALRFYSARAVEFSLEANPESLDNRKLTLLRDSGVGRISMGVQSFDDKKLDLLGRLHSASSARERVIAAVKKGFNNVGIDLIFAVPTETMVSWKADLRSAVSLPVKHICAYSFSCERGTGLYRKVFSGSLALRGERESAGMYLEAMRFLESCGFKQYEISNFAKKGYCCRHNLRYWENQPYIGLGPSAVSYLGGVRSRNVSSLKEYIRRVRSNENHTVFCERLSAVRTMRESSALKIRTMSGIDFAAFRKRWGRDFMDVFGAQVATLSKKGLLKIVRGQKGVCLTRKGVLFGDMVCAELV